MDIVVKMQSSGARRLKLSLSGYKLFGICLALLFTFATPATLFGEEYQKVDIDQFLSGGPTFLKVDEAFKLDAEIDAEGRVHASWQMVDGYYLYQHRFALELRDGNSWSLGEMSTSEGKHKVDEYFGEVVVHYHDADVKAKLSTTETPSPELEVGVSYQGCADAGLCYPPETKWVTLSTAGLAPALFSADLSAASAEPTGGEISPEQTLTPPSGSPQTARALQTEERRLASMLSTDSMWKSVLFFFLAGIGLAFTPCVLPMVPILSSIIVGQGENIGRSRAFGLSLSYVLGMALTYAFVGVLMGYFGASMNLQAALQSPPLLIFFALVFVALSFSMFGFYELQLPRALQDRLNSASQGQSGGKFTGVFIMGSLSSLVVSPCVSAPLAGALIYISQSEDALLGGGVLLALGLGMGVPLMIIGSSGGHLLPRAGKWMDGVKAVFGVGLLAVAVWLLERILPGSVTLLLWAALAIGSGVYLGALDFSPRTGWAQLWKASGAFAFIYGILLLIGAASGANDPFRPLAQLGGSVQGGVTQEEQLFVDVNNLDELNNELRVASAAGKPVFFDFYADWCISCKVMEREVFPDARVSRLLAQFHLVRADVTEYVDAHKQLLSHYDLPGPPSMIFYSSDGVELTELRISGEMDAEAFGRHLEYILAI